MTLQKEFTFDQKKIKNHIDKTLDKKECMEILKILLKNKIDFTENNNGVFLI